MTTETAKVEDVPAIIEGEVAGRTEAIAANAAAQIDDANKTAEALARAAEGSHLGTRLQALEEGNTQWRAQMEQRLAETAAQSAAQGEALKLSILEAMSKPQLPTPTPEAIPVASVSDELAPNSKLPDTTKEKTPESPPPRKRVLI